MPGWELPALPSCAHKVRSIFASDMFLKEKIIKELLDVKNDILVSFSLSMLQLENNYSNNFMLS